MLSLERMVEIDPNLAGLTEPEIEEIRAAFYENAQLAFEVYWNKKYGSKYPIGSFTPPADGSTL